MNPATQREPQRNLDRAYLWRWMAACFRYPDAETHAELANGAAWRAAAALARDLNYGGVAAALGAAEGASRGLLQGDLEAAHAATFGHSVHAAAPPYEAEWGLQESLLQPHHIADVSAFYRAHGVRPAHGGERADHVGVECEFLHFLLLKEARARDGGDAANADLCAQGFAKFLEDHVARFVPAFAGRLAGKGAASPYGPFAAALLALVRAECAFCGVRAGDEGMAQRPLTDDDEACMTCPLHAPAQAPR